MNKATLGVNVAKVEAKEKELAEAKAKAKVPITIFILHCFAHLPPPFSLSVAGFCMYLSVDMIIMWIYASGFCQCILEF